jgi:hypothetical protein
MTAPVTPSISPIIIEVLVDPALFAHRFAPPATWATWRPALAAWTGAGRGVQDWAETPPELAPN